jgi:hypothetical protein
MNRLIAFALPTDRIFLWPDRFRTATAPLIRKTNHAADL